MLEQSDFDKIQAIVEAVVKPAPAPTPLVFPPGTFVRPTLAEFEAGHAPATGPDDVAGFAECVRVGVDPRGPRGNPTGRLNDFARHMKRFDLIEAAAFFKVQVFKHPEKIAWDAQNAIILGGDSWFSFQLEQPDGTFGVGREERLYGLDLARLCAVVMFDPQAAPGSALAQE